MVMRVTTAQSFDSGIERLQKRQRELSEAQLQLTSGKRVAKASDDPTAAARAERALAEVSRRDADARAIGAGQRAMEQAEAALGDAGDLMQQAREALLAAGNASYSDAERAVVAQRLAGLRDALLAVANRADGSGGYLFAGQGATEPPFVDGVGGVAFRGVAGEMRLAGDEQPLPRTLDGRAAWLGAPTGNGLFETRAASAAPEAAGAWIDAGRVTDAQAFFAATSPPAVADPDALTYSVQFSGSTFSVLKDGAATALTNAPYVSGQAIEIDGMAFTISGNPRAGDAFELRLAQPAGSVFATLDQAITELKTPQRSTAAITQGVQAALAALDGSMGAVQGLRARAGEAIARGDDAQLRNAAQKLAAQTERSNAEDLDMVEAISEFQNRQSGYDAALKSYSTVQRLSLFQYLNG